MVSNRWSSKLWAALAAGAVALAAAACNTGDPVVDDTATLAGTVVDAETGAALAGVEVTTNPETDRATTDADGRWAIVRGTRLGLTYQVSATLEGFSTETAAIALKQGVNTVDLRLPVLRICTPGAKRCAQGGPEGVETCGARGNVWSASACPTDQVCDATRTEPACAPSFPLTIARDGPGSGLVLSTPAGITCGDSCTKAWPAGTMVTLTANPFVLSSFGGWSGDCASAGTSPSCTVTLDAAKTARARFEISGHLVTIDRIGAGRVTSMPDGINCPTTCRAGFASGAEVTLHAAPNSGAVFGGWSGGGCSGTALDCTITVDADVNIEARFMSPQFALGVTKAGTGQGYVSSTPDGIDCGATCQADFDRNSMVTLTAEPGTASTFAGWSGDCAGTGDCVVTMSAAKNVTATFDGIVHPVTVAKTGDGAGRVSSAPSGLDCGATCSASFGEGERVTLTAEPEAGHTFDGWSGDCTGSAPTCELTVDAEKTVSASFTITAPWLLPLAADAHCAGLFHFDAPSPLVDACGGASATITGAYGPVTSRNGPLGSAYAAAGPSEDAWIDTSGVGLVPPEGTVELTIKKSGSAFQSRARGVLYSNKDANDAGGPGFRLWVTNDGRLGAEVEDGAGGTTTVQTGAGVIANDRWYQIAATVSSSVGIQLFVEGQSAAAHAGPLTFAASSSTAYAGAEREGAAGARDRFNGTIDELRVSDVVRY